MSNTIPTLVSDEPGVPYFTILPFSSIVAISPISIIGLTECINLTLSSFSFKLNLDCTLSIAPAKNGLPAIIGSPSGFKSNSTTEPPSEIVLVLFNLKDNISISSHIHVMLVSDFAEIAVTFKIVFPLSSAINIPAVISSPLYNNGSLVDASACDCVDILLNTTLYVLYSDCKPVPSVSPYRRDPTIDETVPVKVIGVNLAIIV